MQPTADALTFLPGCHIVAECIDASRDFMTRHTGILKPGPQTFLDQGIAMANAACFNLHAHLSRSRLRNHAFYHSQSPPALLICVAFIVVLMIDSPLYEIATLFAPIFLMLL